MSTVAAIDIGSNALRLAVASMGPGGQLLEPEIVREPVRLGRDVFQQGALGPEMIERLVGALLRFRARLEALPADHVRVVATSALREAKNRHEVLARVRESTGFAIDVIDGAEEARLVLMAVARRFDLRGKTTLLVDLGGGSAEITVAVDGAAVASGTYEMGSVRMLEAFGAGAPRGLVRHVRGFLEPMGSLVLGELGFPRIDQAFGAGGNLDALGDLARRLLGRDSPDVVRREDLQALIETLVDLPYDERVRRLRLRPDRADVILPAAVVYHFVMEILQLREMTIPRVGLKDGVLLELADHVSGLALRLPEGEVLATARRLGAKYAFDAPHAEAVTRLAALLFDATSPLHGLGREDRLLLQVAALLHDIGRFVNLVDHHKHSHYLIEASPIFGLSPLQRRIVAVVARYHRKTLPRFRHEAFLALEEADRTRVRKLAALLGLANGLDAEHGACVESMGMKLARGVLCLSLRGRGDLLLERWAVARHATLFEDVYRTKVVIDEPTTRDPAPAGVDAER